MPFHEKSFFSPKKWIFRWFSAYFIVFIKKINKKMNIATIYFFLKNFINDVFFNVFRSINDILHKTPFYKYNIGNLNKEKKVCLKSYFLYVFIIFHLLVEEKQKIHSFVRQYYFFSLKLHKLPIFMFLSLFYDNTFFL